MHDLELAMLICYYQPDQLLQPTFQDTAVVRFPLWAFNSTVGRLIGKQDIQVDGEVVEDEDSDAAQPTPGSDSAAEDFELLDKSTDSLGKAKSSGTQQGGRSNKRKNKKR